MNAWTVNVGLLTAHGSSLTTSCSTRWISVKLKVCYQNPGKRHAFVCTASVVAARRRCFASVCFTSKSQAVPLQEIVLVHVRSLAFLPALVSMLLFCFLAASAFRIAPLQQIPCGNACTRRWVIDRYNQPSCVSLDTRRTTIVSWPVVAVFAHSLFST